MNNESSKIHIQRIPVDGGFTCPNRDGRYGHDGCSFCNPKAFSPSYCQDIKSIREQLEKGKEFFAKKYRGEVKFLAYFQSYSGTYAPIETLRKRYEEALQVEDIVGLVIGTRPDCISDDTLKLLEELNKKYSVIIEYGVESCYDKTLLRIGRGHDYACAEEAIRKTAALGIEVGVHLIIGLPGETKEEILQEATILSSLPICTLKLHQLQILRDTRMAIEWKEFPEDFLHFTADEYAEFVAEFIMRLRKDIKLDRIAAGAPSDLLLAPRWGLKPQVVQKMIEQRLAEKELLLY